MEIGRCPSPFFWKLVILSRWTSRRVVFFLGGRLSQLFGVGKKMQLESWNSKVWHSNLQHEPTVRRDFFLFFCILDPNKKSSNKNQLDLPKQNHPQNIWKEAEFFFQPSFVETNITTSLVGRNLVVFCNAGTRSIVSWHFLDVTKMGGLLWEETCFSCCLPPKLHRNHPSLLKFDEWISQNFAPWLNVIEVTDHIHGTNNNA